MVDVFCSFRPASLRSFRHIVRDGVGGLRDVDVNRHEYVGKRLGRRCPQGGASARNRDGVGSVLRDESAARHAQRQRERCQ